MCVQRRMKVISVLILDLIIEVNAVWIDLRLSISMDKPWAL